MSRAKGKMTLVAPHRCDGSSPSKNRCGLRVAAVVVRQQAPEDERQLNAAIDLLLSEWVRRRIGQEGKK